jgi:YD repeat-containing protein
MATSGLDLASYTDREGRQWTYAYDANRRLTAVTDPAAKQTQFGYNVIPNMEPPIWRGVWFPKGYVRWSSR